MNKYCKHKVLQFYQLYTQRLFDQDDVALFIILTRSYTNPGSIFRELGDFLAHPEKDQGLVLDQVKIIAINFEEEMHSYISDPDFKPPIFKGLGTHKELIEDLDRIFKCAGVSKQPTMRDDSNFRDFVFCVVFLLSSFKIKIKSSYGELKKSKKKPPSLSKSTPIPQKLSIFPGFLKDTLYDLNVIYSHSLSLQISYESMLYPGFSVTMSILSLGNVWIDCPRVFTPAKHSLKGHIARRFQEGMLAAIAYQDDIPQRLFKTKDFEVGKCWPLPDLKKAIARP